MPLFPTPILIALGMPPSNEERNVALLRWPWALIEDPNVAAGTLPAGRTGFAVDARRVWALPGPGATLRGLAGVLQERLLTRVPGWTKVETADLPRLGSALYRVARKIETGTAEVPTSALADERWLVGTMFPLPVWKPTSAPLQVDTAALTTAMAAVPPFSFATLGEWSTAGLARARPLDQLDPFTVLTAIKGENHVPHAVDEIARLQTLAGNASSAATATQLGRDWGARARWNPYAALFPVLEIMAHYRRTSAGLMSPFTAGFYTEFTQRELELFAATSAGYALIRCFWRASAAGRIASIAALLGTPATNVELSDNYPPSTGRMEPPVANGETDTKLPTLSSKLSSPNPLMGFGRVVPFTVAGYHNYRGVAWAGTVPPDAAINPSTGNPIPVETTFPSAAAKSQWSRVLAAVSKTEGKLDAATSWDSATVSLGFQQWSMHIKDSGPALLSRLKRLHPELFDAIVRSSEIDAGIGANPTTATGSAITEVVTRVNAVGQPQYELWALSPPGTQHLNALDPAKPNEEYPRSRVQAGFGWTKSGDNWVIGEPSGRFVARWAVAARFSPAIWQAQAELAYAGIIRLYASLGGASTSDYSRVWRNWGGRIDLATIPNLPGVEDGGTSRPATVFDLFKSEAAIASVLDHSVNLPGHVALDIRRALVHAAAAQSRERAITVVDAEFLWRILMAHQGTRQLNDKGGVVDVAPLRVGQLVRLYDDVRGASLMRPFLWQ